MENKQPLMALFMALLKSLGTWLMSFAFAIPAVTASASSRGFDVNDAFFLLPTTKNIARPMYPDIRLSDLNRSNGRPLVGKKLYKSIVDQFAKITDGAVGVAFMAPNMTSKEYAYFRITNLRYDPCFPGPQADPKDCVQQIRLVATPIDDNDNPKIPARVQTGTEKLEFMDYSVHLLYAIGTGLPKKDDPVIKELLEIMAESDRTGLSTAGKALGVHPGLAREMETSFRAGNEGPLAKRVRAFVLNHVSESNLVEVTVTNGEGSDGRDGLWNFAGGLVQSGKWKPKTIPRLNKEIVQRTHLLGRLQPKPLIGPTVTKQSEQAPTQAEIEDTYLLLNPAVTNPSNTDCASCHLASVRAIQLSEGGVTGTVQSAFKTPKGVTGFADPKVRVELLDSSIVRVVGYLGGRPTVTTMAANSAALVAETLNTIQGLRPPTHLDCSAPIVRSCFDGVGPKGEIIHSSAEDCLKLCQRRE